MISSTIKFRFCFFSALALSAIGLLIGTSCSSTSQNQEHRLDPDPQHVSYWNGDSMTGRPSIRINLSEQRAYFYKGGDLAGVSLISSGREGHDTVIGNFKITQKDEYHRSSQYGNYVNADGEIIQKDVDTQKSIKPEGAQYVGAAMPYFMRIVGGTGMHQGFLPGYPDSHGCIRMPGFMAEAFFRSVSVGTPVSIE